MIGLARGVALTNYYELEMDSAPAANGIMDARFQPSSPVKDFVLCQKLGLTPFFPFFRHGLFNCALQNAFVRMVPPLQRYEQRRNEKHALALQLI